MLKIKILCLFALLPLAVLAQENIMSAPSNTLAGASSNGPAVPVEQTTTTLEVAAPVRNDVTQDPVIAKNKLGTNRKEHLYDLSYVDIPVFAATSAWTLYTFSKIYYKDRTPVEDILKLDKKNVNGFDRWSAGYQDKNLAKTSDYIFYGSMPLPIFLMLDKKIRHDGFRVGFLYLEAMAITGAIYGSSPYFVDRYRPEIYKTDLGMEERTNVNGRNSFFAGHVATVATSTFFCASVYADYHPDDPFRWVLYGAAIAATGTCGYMRVASGKHFLSDVLVGTAVGTLSGVLVPYFHKNKNFNKQAWMLTPDMQDGMGGFTFTYKL